MPSFFLTLRPSPRLGSCLAMVPTRLLGVVHSGESCALYAKPFFAGVLFGRALSSSTVLVRINRRNHAFFNLGMVRVSVIIRLIKADLRFSQNQSLPVQTANRIWAHLKSSLEADQSPEFQFQNG